MIMNRLFLLGVVFLVSIGLVNALSYGELPSVMSQNQMVQDLPKDGNVLLQFYNFNSGKRQIEKSFSITKGSVVQGAQGSSDVKLLLHSKYLPKMNNDNYCSVIKEANRNRDLGFSSTLSSFKLGWKYKGMMKYMGCFK